jgi:acetyl esterase/lipase
MPSSEAAALFARLRERRRPRPPVSYEQRRRNLERVSRPPDAGVRCEPVDCDSVPAEWIIAPGAADDRVVLYLHGGGFTIGSIVTHRQLAGWLSATAKARILLIDYRLAPEHPFPAALDDALTAYRWLLREHEASTTVLAGDSAGGGLVASCLLAIRDSDMPLPAASVLMSPWVDLALTGESLRTRAALDPLNHNGRHPLVSMTESVQAYLASMHPMSPLASPLYADLRGLPPLLIQVGTDEALFDDAMRFDAQARRAGVSVSLQIGDGMPHVYQFFAWHIPEAREALERAGQFIQAHTPSALRDDESDQQRALTMRRSIGILRT